jgi:prephenate dehydrogenase
MIESIAIIGVGMIGGSIARSLRDKKVCENIIGIDACADTLAIALNEQLVDEAYASVEDCPLSPNVVIVCVPVSVISQVFAQCRDWFAECEAITDVGSTKQSVIDDLQTLMTELPANFVPAHPIAGRELSGVQAAVSGLFDHKKVILTPTLNTAPNSLMCVTQMWQEIGATSHLPHVLAYALVHCLANQTQTPEIFRYAAGGFSDFTRIASSDPALWRDICMANQAPLVEAIEGFETTLKQLREDIQNQEGDALQKMFEQAKIARDKFTQ